MTVMAADLAIGLGLIVLMLAASTLIRVLWKAATKDDLNDVW